MKILVTGGNGFIGRHLCQHLLADGHTVTVLDDLSGSKREYRAYRLSSTFIEGTTSNNALMRELITKADMVFHLASVTGHLAVSENPQKIYDDIVAGAINLTEHINIDQPTIVFSSSAALGNGIIKNASEAYPLSGASYDGNKQGYGAGKAELENICLTCGKNIRVIRLFNIVGVGQTGRYGMVLPRFVSRALLGLPVVIFNNGSHLRTYGNVETFIDCLMKVTRASSYERVFNIGADNNVLSVNALLSLIEKQTGPVRRHYQDYHEVFKKDDVIERTPDTSLLKHRIGAVKWETPEIIVEKVIKWMQTLDDESLLYHAGV